MTPPRHCFHRPSRNLAWWLVALSHATTALLAQAAPPSGIRGDTTVVSPGAQLERLFTGADFTEGPAQAPDGSVYFSQITVTKLATNRTDSMFAGQIWRYDPRTRRATIYRSPSGQANGIAFDLQGRMLVAEGADFGGRRVTRTDLASGKSVIVAALYSDRPFNAPNDLVLDTLGRIYFTDPRYFGPEPIDQPVQGVYRIDPGGKVSLIAADAGKPNGITISPDQSTLYVASLDFGATDLLPDATPPTRGPMALFAYDLAPDGTLNGRRTLIDFAPGMGPDGITVDRDGNLYLAIPAPPAAHGIHVVSPQGTELAFIPTPEWPTNVKFGRGADARTLFITAGQSLYRIQVRRRGFYPGH